MAKAPEYGYEPPRSVVNELAILNRRVCGLLVLALICTLSVVIIAYKVWSW